MALRGGMNVAIPMFMLGAGLLGQNMAFPNGFPWQQKSTGQTSRVNTSVLATWNSTTTPARWMERSSPDH